jgi:hypothetical protein
LSEQEQPPPNTGGGCFPSRIGGARNFRAEKRAFA